VSIPLIDIFDVKERRIQTALIVPKDHGSTQACVRFDMPFGLGGSYYLSTILEVALVYEDHGSFIITDCHDGSDDVYVPVNWVRQLAKSAMKALPHESGSLVLSVTFHHKDPMDIPF
jgi:hypothetical protein